LITRDTDSGQLVELTPSIRRLVIDDYRTFGFPNEDPMATTYVRTNDAARIALIDGHWDEVWFDHDMGLPLPLDAIIQLRTAREIKAVLKDATTQPLANEMEEHPERYDIDKIYIHTSNPAGAIRLAMALRNWNPIRIMLRHSGDDDE